MSDSSSSSGLDVFGVTFLIFMTLKLCGIIAWSWWWVTAPLWGPLVAVSIILFVSYLIAKM